MGPSAYILKNIDDVRCYVVVSFSVRRAMTIGIKSLVKIERLAENRDL